MKLLTKGRATFAALVAGGLFALTAAPALASKSGAEIPGSARITDEAALFSNDAKHQAEQRMANARFDRGLHFHVDTYKALPADVKARYDAAGPDKARFMKDWAKTVATGDRAKGPYVLICQKPGWTVVLIDEETVNRGFGKGEEDHIKSLFDNAMKAAGAKENANAPRDEVVRIRDAALLQATDYVIADLRGTKVIHTDGTPTKETKAATAPEKKGMSIGGWICLGICVLLAIWLVVGIIRALTAPSYGGGYGGGGYGGGGGFGFGTALLGGMFGAMAGMWLYNSMMGTHYPPQAFGGEATAGDSYSGSDTGDTGAGDYSDV